VFLFAETRRAFDLACLDTRSAAKMMLEEKYDLPLAGVCRASGDYASQCLPVIFFLDRYIGLGLAISSSLAIGMRPCKPISCVLNAAFLTRIQARAS
jgi:hypothetical protein